MLASRLGALVKERRMLRQLTQAELACLAGVSRAVVTRLERPGSASVRIDSVERVLRALGVSVRIGGDRTAAFPEHRGTVVVLH